MKSIANRIEILQKNTGGIRIPTKYENTFGHTVFEEMNISAAAPWQTRIISELIFAHRLSANNNNTYDKDIENALDFLEEKIKSKGAFTLEDVYEAEKLLSPVAEKAKDYKVILAAHAHIDMNWLWSWHETVAATLDTFRTMLTLMEEYPDFTFSQSQAAVYKIVEDFDPQMMERIKKRIAEGRWEVTASTWVENDQNMPSERSFIAHNYYAKKYLTEKYAVAEKDLCIDFCPDTFGHNINMGEFMENGEVKYMYHCRGGEFNHILYKFVTPSGVEKLHYREPFWYNSGITPHIGTTMPDVSAINGGLKTGLIVYGVGDHGGGPTRRDIEFAKIMMDWPIFPKIKFGTLKEYFAEAEAVRDNIPVIKEPLNYLFTGCYSSQSRLKQAHKKTENALISAETINALAKTVTDVSYSHKSYEKAWQNVLFTHFHDILTGSCIADSREHAMGLLDEALAVSNTAYASSMRAVASQIDTTPYDILPKGNTAMSQAEGAGSAYSAGSSFGINTRSPLYCVSTPSAAGGKTRIFHIFNITPYSREEVCEIAVWDWGFDLSRVKMLDGDMNEIAFQVTDPHPWKYWDHMFFRVIIPVKVPAYGYTTVVLTERELEDYPMPFNHNDNWVEKPFDNYILENEQLRAEFDAKDCMLISLIDKTDGNQLLTDGKAGLYINEVEATSSSAWRIGRYISSNPVTNCTKAEIIRGNIRDMIKATYSVLGSQVEVEYYLDKDSGALQFKFELNWREITLPGNKIPVLTFNVPCAADKYIHDIPCGIAEAGARAMDIPGLSFTSAVKDDKALTLICDSRYGYRNTDKGIAVTLIHTQNNPDLYPEVGHQTVNAKLYVGKNDINEIKAEAVKLNSPLSYVTSGIHSGRLEHTSSLVQLEGKVFVHGIKQCEDGGLIIYMSNPHQTEETATLTFPTEIKSACTVNSLEKEIDLLKPNGNKVETKIGGYKLTGIKITL